MNFMRNNDFWEKLRVDMKNSGCLVCERCKFSCKLVGERLKYFRVVRFFAQGYVIVLEPWNFRVSLFLFLKFPKIAIPFKYCPKLCLDLKEKQETREPIICWGFHKILEVYEFSGCSEISFESCFLTFLMINYETGLQKLFRK